MAMANYFFSRTYIRRCSLKRTIAESVFVVPYSAVFTALFTLVRRAAHYRRESKRTANQHRFALSRLSLNAVCPFPHTILL